MAGKKKTYVVLKGYKPGLYDTWADAKAQVDGFTGAVYRGFESIDEAQKAFVIGKFPPAPKKAIDEKEVVESSANHRLKESKGKIAYNPDSIAVDAACSGNPGLMEYRGVDNLSGVELFRIAPRENGTNNIGEFLAIVHALAFLKRYGSNRLIYSDSKTAIAWVKNKNVRTQLPRTAKTKDVWELVDRALDWLHNNTYTNKILKWETEIWGENPADFGRK